MIEIAILIVFALLVIGSLFKPSIAVTTVMLGYMLEQLAQTKSYFFIQQSWIGNAAMGLSVLFALISLQLRGKRPLTNLSTTFYLGMLLLLYCTASTTWSLTPGGLSTVLRHSPYIAISFLLTPLLIQSTKGLQDIVKTCAIMGAITLVVLLSTTSLSELAGRSLKLAESENLVAGKTADGNPLAVASAAGYIAICAAFVRFRHGQTLFSLARWGLVLLCLIVIVRSGSRGQLLGCVASIGLFMPVHLGVKDLGKLLRLTVAATAFFAVVGGVYVTMMAGRMRWGLDFVQEQFSGDRGYSWSTVISAWLRSDPVSLLLGMGSFSSNAIIGRYPHNLTVEILAEQGFVGFTILVAFILSAAYAFSRLLAIYKGPQDRAAIISLAALAFFELLLHQKQSSYFGISTLYIFMIGLGRCYAFSASPEGQRLLQQSHLQALTPIGFGHSGTR